MQDEDFDILLQKADPDRRLAALFATPQVRDRLFALYAFNHELGKIADASSESMIGEMKLTWWRDAVSDLYAETPKVRRHAITEGLAPLTDMIPQAEWMGLIEARFDDISARPFTSLDAVVDSVDETAGRLVRLASTLCEAELDADRIRAAGRAWGLTGLLRAFPLRARIGRAPVGGDDLARVEATPAMLAQGLGEAKVAEAIRPVREAAACAIRDFRSGGALPPEAVPAVGYAVLAPAYLKALPSSPYALAPERPLLPRQMRLTWLSLTGR